MLSIQPVILCGGSGTRLWPISTQKIPKQFITVGKRGTLLEETIRRVALVMKTCESKHAFKTYDQLLIMHHSHSLPEELSIYESSVIYEPFANDTGVAIAKAVLEIKNRHNNENVTVLVLPADHYIDNINEFVNSLVDGILKVSDNNIVLFGIQPLSPESKYGYIIPTINNGISFKEKPDRNMAINLISKGALWNSGIVAAKLNTILTGLKMSSYNIMDWITNPREGKALSFDVAVLQEYPYLYAQICNDWRWSDVGTWDAFTEIPEVKAEMIPSGTTIIHDSSNVNVLNRGHGKVVVFGCSDLLVVVNGNDILIKPNNKDYNTQLKELASSLNAIN